MITINGTNVNDLYHGGMRMLQMFGRKSDSRNGPVTVMECPVMSVYDKPTQRVLFDERRDANPFFHLFECLWMLSGQNDATMLDAYVATFSKRYADNGVIHGAYGHRWRHALGFDQLDEVVAKLRKNRDDRQAVIQMWDASHSYDDTGHEDLRGNWKDRPCNTHVYLRVRENYERDYGHVDSEQPTRKYVLDLTVMCRSNDIVWGAYGANAVHFSFLQEYLAGRIGVGVGKMFQLSNNYHAYDDVFLPLTEALTPIKDDDPYSDELVVAMPIGDSFYHWDEDLSNFMRWHASGLSDMTTPTYHNKWFDRVAAPMCMANKARRAGFWDMAVTRVRQVEADDWRRAALGWIGRHRK